MKNLIEQGKLLSLSFAGLFVAALREMGVRHRQIARHRRDREGRTLPLIYTDNADWETRRPTIWRKDESRDTTLPDLRKQ